MMRQSDPLYQIQQVARIGMAGLALGQYAANCGVGAALEVVGSEVGGGLSHLWSEFTDWTSTGDPRRFGQSFGFFLSVVGSEGASGVQTTGIRALDAMMATTCFPAGTLIATAAGEKAIEEVKAETGCSPPIRRRGNRVTRRSPAPSCGKRTLW
jgi:hypothetical protein